MSINQLACGPRGRLLIIKFEEFRLNAWQNDEQAWRIGYNHAGPDAQPGMTITQEQADQLLTNDLVRIGKGVNALTTVKLNQNQFDALVSYSFNLGLSELQRSMMLRLLNAGNYQAAADQIPRQDRPGSKQTAATLARRKAERELFLAPT